MELLKKIMDYVPGSSQNTPLVNLPPAKLYTKFISAKKEYRVHIVGGKAIAVHRKVQEQGSTGGSEVKNTANGWKFKKVISYPPSIVEEAIKAVHAVGLDFAAIDVIWDGDKAWVLEANTAPGIYEMKWTVGQYAKALKELAENV